MVEMAVREGQHVHVAGFERLAQRMGLEAATLLAVSCLEAFASVDDGDAVWALTKLPLTARSGVGRAEAVPST